MTRQIAWSKWLFKMTIQNDCEIFNLNGLHDKFIWRMRGSRFSRTSENVLNGLGLTADGRAPLQGRGGQGGRRNEAVGVHLGLEGHETAEELSLKNEIKEILVSFILGKSVTAIFP